MTSMEIDCNPILPIELITLILFYLPLKSLLRFRQVNKTWKEIIHHVANQSNKSCFVFARTVGSKAYIFCENEDGSLFTSAMMSWRKIGPKNNSPTRSFNKGIFCFSSIVSEKLQHYRTYMYNTSTQQLHRLPKLNPSKPQLRHSATAGGLDLSTSQFKVVMICDTDDDNTGLKRSGYIHILGSNSWRKLHPAPREVCFQRTVVVINGMIYWLTLSSRIMSFDLATEMFGYFESPWFSFVGTFDRRKLRLADLGGCLSVCDSRPDNHAEIWVMREASWTKIVDVAKTFVPAAELQGVFFRDVLPITILKNGEMLLLYGSLVLVSYNFEMKRYSPLQISGLPGYDLSDIRDHGYAYRCQYEVHPHWGNVS